MMAVNHAVTGAIIGLSIENPAVALPLAFASHFALDVIPHYDPPNPHGNAAVFQSKRFIFEQLVLNGALCIMLVIYLAISQPKHWLVAAICAFLATSPDLMWLPRFVSAQRAGRDIEPHNPVARFHSRIQWLTGPKLIWLELLWLAGTSAILGQII
jgi:hypothetical protein